MKLRPSTTVRATKSAPLPSAPSCSCAMDAEPEWRAFRSVLVDAIECAIEHACARVCDFPEDVAALEHLRDFSRRRISGVPSAMRVSDLLSALGILLGAFEAERCAPSVAGYAVHTTVRRLRDVAQTVGLSYPDPMQEGASITGRCDGACDDCSYASPFSVSQTSEEGERAAAPDAAAAPASSTTNSRARGPGIRPAYARRRAVTRAGHSASAVSASSAA